MKARKAVQTSNAYCLHPPSRRSPAPVGVDSGCTHEVGNRRESPLLVLPKKSRTIRRWRGRSAEASAPPEAPPQPSAQDRPEEVRRWAETAAAGAESLQAIRARRKAERTAAWWEGRAERCPWLYAPRNGPVKGTQQPPPPPATPTPPPPPDMACAAPTEPPQPPAPPPAAPPAPPAGKAADGRSADGPAEVPEATRSAPTSPERVQPVQPPPRQAGGPVPTRRATSPPTSGAGPVTDQSARNGLTAPDRDVRKARGDSVRGLRGTLEQGPPRPSRFRSLPDP